LRLPLVGSLMQGCLSFLDLDVAFKLDETGRVGRRDDRKRSPAEIGNRVALSRMLPKIKPGRRSPNRTALGMIKGK